MDCDIFETKQKEIEHAYVYKDETK
jgi:hypothetical protein